MRKPIHQHLVLMTMLAVTALLAGCVGFVQFGKPGTVGQLPGLAHTTPVVGAVTGKPPGTGLRVLCDPFEPPRVTGVPQVLLFTEKQLADSDYMAEVTAIYAAQLKAYATRTNALWEEAYAKYKDSCEPVAAVTTP